MTVKKYTCLLFLLLVSWPYMPSFDLGAQTAQPPNGWQDYRRHLNRKFKKIKRDSTRYIILHGTESGLQSSLQTISKGKKFKGSRFRTYGGHAHYLIDRNGRIYYIVDEKFRADHAGLSLWDGLSDLSSHSLGIELVAYVNGDITDKQYESLTFLLTVLRIKYKIPDRNVLTHAHVAFGRANPWFRRDHRGRKRDGVNLDMSKLGLREFWDHDPDVKAGRLLADPLLSKLLFTRIPGQGSPEGSQNATPLTAPGNDNLIRLDNTAWTIAGEEYDSPETLYILPGDREIRGDRIEREIGWNRLPIGTRVLLYQTADPAQSVSGPIHLINADATAWSYAGSAYRAATTFYITPDGGITRGDQIKDWDQIPGGTRMLIGYREPLALGAVRGTTPWSLAKGKFKDQDTVYFIPPSRLIPGTEVDDFANFPKGSLLFLPIK